MAKSLDREYLVTVEATFSQELLVVASSASAAARMMREAGSLCGEPVDSLRRIRERVLRIRPVSAADESKEGER